MSDSLKEESKTLSSVLDVNGYVLGQLMIEDMPHLGIAMDKQIVVVASSGHLIFVNPHRKLLAMAKKVNFPMWIRRGDKHFVQYPCHLSRNNLSVNDRNDKALDQSLMENSASLNLAFQLCGEAESCSIEITSEEVLQGKILLFTRQNCLISKKNWWRTYFFATSPIMKRMGPY
jgi:hypothetical protein